MILFPTTGRLFVGQTFKFECHQCELLRAFNWTAHFNKVAKAFMLAFMFNFAVSCCVQINIPDENVQRGVCVARPTTHEAKIDEQENIKITFIVISLRHRLRCIILRAFLGRY